MSSTWFNNVRALKKECNNGIWQETKYILIANTAESNVYNNNGGHDYHEGIIAFGTYEQVMREIGSWAYQFDNGVNKWKPNHKDSVGFMKVCKKALQEAESAIKIPYNINGIIMWQTHNQFEYIFDLYANTENVKQKTMYNDLVLYTDDIETYINVKGEINRMIQDYKEYIAHANNGFKTFIDENKERYNYKYLNQYQ
jgi:hypothetical protein